MASKYLKNEKGIVRAITTDNLQLEKPLLNENYDIEVHNRNMDKIDSAIQEVKGNVDGLELTAERVSIADPTNKFEATNVEDALFENKTSILKQEKDIESLKLSVSNGKQLIASAITDKGIDTSNEDSFQIMANNIGNIKTGINVSMNETQIDYDFDLDLLGAQWLNVGVLPYDYFYNGCAVIFNGELHMLGGATSDMSSNHYKYNNKKWVSVSTLPCRFSDGSAVVLNGEIHILGGDSINNYMNHYKYNGSEWISVSTLPYPFYSGCALIYNDEIHILGTDSSNYKTCHYKFDGISWTSVSTLPYGFSNGCAVIINEEIHILGPISYHYKYNGDSWTSVSSIPYSFSSGCAVIFNGEIHILGGAGSSGGIYTYYRHSKYNGSSWTYLDNIPFQFYNGCSLVINRGITLLGSGSSSYRKSHYNCVEVYDIVRKEG